jgi:hypothetical protein
MAKKMNNSKQKMSASYKAIFVLSIFMVFFVLIAGAATKSKSSGLGMFIWGYTAWLMYKRRISDLISFYKVVLWIDAIAVCIVIAVPMISDINIGYSLADTLVLLGLVILISYVLYRYFLNIQSNLSSVASSEVTDSLLWGQVSEEIKNGKRVDSLWTRAFAEADGDDNKTNARYVKLRYEQLKNESNLASSNVKTNPSGMADFLNGFKDGLKENKSNDSNKRSGESNDYLIYLTIGGCVLVFNNFKKIENFILDFFK